MTAPPIKPMLLATLALMATGACHKASQPPVDDTASDVAALPVPAISPNSAATAKPNSAPVPAKFKATGTEPFWGAAVDGAMLVYTTPEFPDGIRITVARRDAGGHAIYAGALEGKPLTLDVAPGPCSDGMSDRIYRFTAVRQIGPDIARGCAN